jgi:iron complex transport system substrate-binding protein
MRMYKAGIPKKWAAMALLCVLGLRVAAQASPGAPAARTRTVIDMIGRTVAVPGEVKRIACIFEPPYEKVVMLGDEDKIVQCVDYHKTHAAWAHIVYKRLDGIPDLSNANISIEEIIKMKPDLVFYSNDAKVAAMMETAGLTVVCTVATGTSIDAMKDILTLFGKALGENEEKRAAEYCKYFDERVKVIAAVTATIPEALKPRVYVVNNTFYNTRGGNSIMADTVEKAGGILVSKDLPPGTSSVVNLEQLMAWDPEIIVIDHSPDIPDPGKSITIKGVYSGIYDDPKLQNISAVKNKRIYTSPTGSFYWDAGQQGILQLMWMAKLFHPDKFPNLDMKKEIKYFYEKFLYYRLSDDEAERILRHELPANAPKYGY